MFGSFDLLNVLSQPRFDLKKTTHRKVISFRNTTYSPYMVSFKGKEKVEYEKIGLPKEMIAEVKRIVETDKRLGFVSIQEFVKEATRKSIVQYGGLYYEHCPDK